MDLKSLPPPVTYQYASVRTPTIPTGPTGFSLSASHLRHRHGDHRQLLHGQRDGGGERVSARAAWPPCAQGAWQVLRSPRRAVPIHSVVLDNGDILFVGGLGNDTSDFARAPSSRRCTTRPGHVPGHPDAGRLLLRRARATAERRHPHPRRTWPIQCGVGTDPGPRLRRQDTSYIFDPVTLKYYKVNNLNQGHWYRQPRGNGDIVSYGGSTTAAPRGHRVLQVPVRR